MKFLPIAITLALVPVFIEAQTSPPAFTTCLSAAFQVVNNPSELETVNLATGVTTTVATFTGIQVNAIGFSPVDNRIYGIRQTTPRRVIVIGSDYSYQLLPLSGAAIPTTNVGDVNGSGVLWCFQSGTLPNSVFTVNCDPSAGVDFGRVTIIGTRPASADAADFSFPPDDDTRMYMVPANGSLIYVSTTDLSVHVVMSANRAIAGPYGSTFFDGNGNFYAKNNTTGVIYRFANATTASPTMTTFSTSTASSSNDGARCAAAPAPVIADFGDAPNNFATFATSGGAFHLLPSLNPALAQIYLGSGVTIDGDGNPSADADLDSDDGISSFTAIAGDLVPYVIPSYTVSVTVHNATVSVANLAAWMDWNNDGIFDADERVATTVAAGYTGIQALTWTNLSLSGPNGTTGTYARFRFSTDNLPDPDGTAGNGEVEDYFIAYDAVLPVTLSSFVAVDRNSSAHLTWVTASEQNNRGFSVEHTSDGNVFKEIGFVASRATNGSSDKMLQYEYIDTRPLVGDNFYRLKQSDFDGRITYSSKAKVVFGASGNAIKVYPNPATDNIVMNGLKGNESIQLYNSQGRLVIKEKALGTNATLDISTLARGVYQLSITSLAGQRGIYKIVKQ